MIDLPPPAPPAPPQPQSVPPDEQANFREGYSTAIALWAYEGNTIWAKFTAMVYANTILLATLGLVITSNRSAQLVVLRIALAALGLGLCIAWVLLTVRSFDFYKYWILSARELEERLVGPVPTVSRGAGFADGREITFRTREPQLHQLRRLSRLAKVETVTYCIISVFAVVYLLTMFS